MCTGCEMDSMEGSDSFALTALIVLDLFTNRFLPALNIL